MIRRRDSAQAEPGETEERAEHERVTRDDPHDIVLVGVRYGEEEAGQEERGESPQTQEPVAGPRAGKASGPDKFEHPRDDTPAGDHMHDVARHPWPHEGQDAEHQADEALRYHRPALDWPGRCPERGDNGTYAIEDRIGPKEHDENP
jgi:hypothetical protein